MLLAAQYLRMSTDKQDYSLDNQAAAIRKYAKTHGMKVVRTYMDAGKSGLSFERRSGLKSLIADVQDGPDFQRVLVYDVSRWGRFQDVDASAHYEYICKMAGIPVIYCMEAFEGGDGPLDAIAKFLKRYMAAEKSRELSAKVFEGQSRLIRLGFKQGGAAGFGLRSLVIDRAGRPRMVLNPGERKALQSDRVIYTLGPTSEIETVREIFDLYVNSKMSCCRIARRLNGAGVKTHLGRAWSDDTVRHILRNPKYVGDTTWNRTSAKLGGMTRRNKKEEWITILGTHEAIVSAELFDAAQERKGRRPRVHIESEDALSKLREMLHREGRLSSGLIDAAHDMPTTHFYRERFGSLSEAYRLVGFGNGQDTVVQRRLRAMLINGLVEGLGAHGCGCAFSHKTGRVVVEGALTIAVTVTTCWMDSFAEKHWMMRRPRGSAADVAVLGRRLLDADDLQDICIVPLKGTRWVQQVSIDEKGSRPDGVRIMPNLAPFIANWREWASDGKELT